MVLRFGQSKAEDVATLIAQKNYTRAIEVIRAQLQSQRADARLRLQLGDTLSLAGRDKEAVQVLAPLADEFAREGFAAKAVAVLKKIQKLDPGRRDVDAKLAELIEHKQRQATVVLPLVPPPMDEPDAAAAPPPTRPPAPAPPAPAPPAPPAPLVPPVPPVPPVPLREPSAAARGQAAPPPPAAPAAPPPAADASSAATLLDNDFFTEDPDLFIADDDAAYTDAAAPAPASGADPMTDGAFAAELLSLVDAAFADVPGGDDGVPMPDHGAGPRESNQIVVSPLFKDLAVDEMVAVIQGLKLLSYEPRQVILREGRPGDSMYMLTAGKAKVYVKNAAGRQVLVEDLEEGAFFGELSVLTGRPRMATVVAATHCELLELDRATLDDITARHPHVRQVLEDFARERLSRRPGAVPPA